MKSCLAGPAFLLALCHALPTVAADGAPTFEAFRGALGKGKKVTFTMLLQREHGTVSGLYFYDAVKTDIPLVGTWGEDGTVTLTESNGKGRPSATFNAKLAGTHLAGHWTELAGARGRPPRDFDFSAEKGLGTVAIAAIAEQAYDGRLGGKHAMRMALSGTAGKLGGYYRYRNSKADLALSGEVSPSGEFRLEERDQRGKVTGAFSGLFLPGLRVFGTWSNPARTKTFPVQLALSRTELRPTVELQGGWRLVPKDLPIDKTCEAAGQYYEVLGLSNAAAAKKIDTALKKLTEENTICGEADESEEMRSFSDHSVCMPLRLGKFLLFNQSFYMEGGVHPVSSSESLVFDTETGDTIDLLAYLKPNQADALSRFVNKKVRDEAEDPSMITGEAEVTSGLIHPFGNGAEILFNPYDVAPYVVGSALTALDKSQLRKYFQVNADTHALFGL